ncbi:MAG TPA: pyruvate carboxyltransferase [Methylomusa anaerophila]|uniref:2-isopropylmalate synthase n=1 Tax=Methylomusa anaerophila TaxID=1930071 RepID=A0A348ALT8_9FIRM|nr:pyruvate carboxyltransferase [Methylomusa anaerophila]BBB92036.1 2-isopropylmalate synthase [Methylomusa anaerophila]HML87953.1 pyruvate carboxyltransferase [Methylomusa anaerophila]
MGGPIICHDQTLCEGFLSGLDHDGLSFITRTLQKIQVCNMDVPIVDIHKYKLPEELLKDNLRGKIRPSRKEVGSAYELGYQKVIVAYRHLPGQSLTLNLCLALDRIRSLGMEAALHIENASRLNIHELEGFWPILEGFAINALVYGDKESVLDPFATYEILTELQKSAPLPLEFHGHNAYGVATANAMSAIRAGVRRVATAVAGVGKRGHAPFEEVVMAAKHLLQEPGAAIDQHLAPSCEAIARCLGLQLPLDKAVVGKNIFAHESGLHVHGVAKNPELYEAFTPEEVGLTRHLVVGKHAGTTSLQVKLRERGIELSDTAAYRLLKKVRKKVVEQKSPLSNTELFQMYLAEGIC